MAEPITTAEAKKHLRVDSSADDTLIADNITAAREWVEDYTGVLLVEREVTERLGDFLTQTKLRAWPVSAAEPVSVVYRDNLGTVKTIADAELRATTRPAVIYPASGAHWPLASTLSSDIDVTFTAGFADPGDIPQVLKQAMLVMLTAFYEDREGGEMFEASEASAKKLCRRWKRRTL